MNSPVASYAVDLLYEERPLFSRDEVLAKLRDRCGAASAMDPSPGGGLNFFFPDLRVPFKEGTAPVQIAMTVNAGAIPARAAYEISKLPDPEAQAALAG